MSELNSNVREELRKSVNERLSRKTNKDISLLIQEVNINSTSDERVNEIISEISGYVGYLLLPVEQNHFYRARYWTHEQEYPLSLSQLLEPKSSDTRQNRCNIEGSPVLYVSEHPNTLIPECDYKDGDIFAMVQFDRNSNTEDLNCMLLGIDAMHKFGEDSRMKEMEDFRKDFFGANFNKFKYIEKELHTQFVRNDDKSGLTYRFTANLCYRLFAKCPDLDAIVYPSIATKGAFNNLAIRPSRYSNTYTASKAGLFEVLSNDSYRQISGAVIGSDMKLSWNQISSIEQPLGVGIRKIDPMNPRIYIAPWKR